MRVSAGHFRSHLHRSQSRYIEDSIACDLTKDGMLPIDPLTSCQGDEKLALIGMGLILVSLAMTEIVE